ncbi:MAG: DegT/DnrJ/EryC1/StrS family aminotransferase [Acidobacteriales bacterium]|nr:DegT/DnrJ/EryC1/StrS family aminotransferase [Terriglobales bacterium]
MSKAGNTRRSFVQTGAAAVAGLGASRAAFPRPATETLALSGGPKTVTFPAARQAEISKWPRYGEEEKKALVELLENNRFYGEIPLLEKEMKDYLNAPYVKAHINGTSALMSMFFGLDLPAGSEIMAPSYTAWATIVPMRFFGYVPIFVDIHPRTACFDLEYAARHLTSRTRAVVPMHTRGLPCDMDHIGAFAKQHGLLVLEDAAQAQGASLQGRPMGTWGGIGVFSFQASKTLPTIEGGMGIYQNREYYERATAFGNYELPETFPQDSSYRKYHDTGFGPKFRIHPLAAALARKQLQTMESRIALLDAQMRKLNDRLVELPGLSVQYCRPDARRVYWAGNLLFLDEAKAGCPKEALIKALRAEGVRISSTTYPEQHKFTIYSEAKWWHHKPDVPEFLPGCAEVNRTSVTMPLFYDEASELIDQYVKAFEKVWAKRSQLARV